MQIGIHAATLLPRLTGRESYVHSLLTALAQIDRANEYHVFVSPANRRLFERPEENFHTVLVRLPRLPSRRLWELAFLRLSARVKTLDLIHLTEAPVPLYSPPKAVATVHDVLPAIYPQFFPWKARLYYQRAYAWGARHLTGINVNSQQTKTDLVERFAAPPDRIRVIPHAADHRFRPLGDVALTRRVRERYGLPDRFILYVGTIEPRKNISRLLRAFRRARDRGLRHSLVIAGGKGWLCDDVFRTATDSAVSSDVLFTGFVDHDDLPALYGAADLFAYPSLYEGFGLPPLEAMASGVPVICSNRSSLPEVVGEAAVLVDPEDEREMAEALLEVATDRGLQARLRLKGLARATEYSWDKTARETLRFYEEVHHLFSHSTPKGQRDAA